MTMGDKMKSAALVIDTRRPDANTTYHGVHRPAGAQSTPDTSRSSTTLFYTHKAETPSTLGTSQYAAGSLGAPWKSAVESADSSGSEWLLGKIDEFLADSPEADEATGMSLCDSSISPLRIRIPRSPLRIEVGLTSALFYRCFSPTAGLGVQDAAPFPYSPTVEVATVATGVRVSVEYGSSRCVSRNDIMGMRRKEADQRRFSRLSSGPVCVDGSEETKDSVEAPTSSSEIGTPPLQFSPASLPSTSLCSDDSPVSNHHPAAESSRPDLSPTITISRDPTVSRAIRPCTADKPNSFPPHAHGLSRSASVGILSALGRAHKVSVSSSNTRPKLIRVATAEPLSNPSIDSGKRGEETGTAATNVQGSPTSTQIVAGRKMHKLKQLLGAEVEGALSPDCVRTVDTMKPLPQLPRTRLQRSGTTASVPALHRDASILGWSSSTCKATVTGRPSSARDTRCTCPACKLASSPNAKVTVGAGGLYTSR